VTKLDAVSTSDSWLPVEPVHLLDVAWKMDPVLELWVNVETMPVTIRLAGVLDDLTGASVLHVVQELLDEGYRDFIMQVDDLERIASDISASLEGIARVVNGAGGTLSWSSWPGRHHARPSVHVD
jgi:hypothetical protein